VVVELISDLPFLNFDNSSEIGGGVMGIQAQEDTLNGTRIYKMQLLSSDASFRNKNGSNIPKDELSHFFRFKVFFELASS
jgi:capsule polysaccharide modification protein KpsS